MKTLYEKFDKARISNYPTIAFPGKITEVSDAEAVHDVVTYLRQHKVIGIDTETRPSFRKGQTHKVALLQLATMEQCFLIHLNLLGLPPAIIALFEDTDIVKVGLSLNDDIHMLQQRQKFTPAGFVDLQTLFPELGIADMSLQKLYANIFHQRISKRQQLSNWESVPLTEKQQSYAATDAWSCLKLYDEYLLLKQNHDYVLIKETTDEQNEE